MDETAKEKLRKALKNIYIASPDSDRVVIVVRCEKCEHYEADRNFCRLWIGETSRDGYCHKSKHRSFAFGKTYLEDYMEKNPDAKLVYGYPTVYPCDEYHELYGRCDGNCRKCWDKRMVVKEKKEND